MFNKYFSKLGETQKNAIFLIILFGIISLLGDVIYEGARSVNGPYLETLGASALIVGLVVGFGEFLGYAIRLLSGYFSDKTKAHWFFTIFGYGLLISVPLLALSNYWQFAAIFIVLERIGKGLRSPARDTILSYATKQVGTGLGFGIAEFLDQIGAVIGPLVFTFVFISAGSVKTVADYQQGYSYFWMPFVMLIMVLFFAYFKVRSPEEFESSYSKKEESKQIPKVFWTYSLFTFVTTLGFVSFAIIGFHLKVQGILLDAEIPFFYAVAMMIDAIFGLVVGKMYDSFKSEHDNEKAGLLLLGIVPILTAVLIPLVFSYNFVTVLIGMLLWGIVMGSHETVMKASIADITSINKRGTAYGIFSVIYGLALFIGAILAGYLYDISIFWMILVLVGIEVLGIPVYFMMKRQIM
ncbi:MFS family permease [Methanococcus maripaludis]|uniref:MFS family permease n=1 Tax=Methanococcus maripaludis TaxID=39152 RepID=A0A7J9NK74_METMI|nr:MFS transporter [Methanococcus maripaludis]MBA2840980.1 MFS family permease [Methanococcus maripaludis]